MKICMLGFANAGKTSITHRLIGKQFTGNIEMTKMINLYENGF